MQERDYWTKFNENHTRNGPAIPLDGYARRILYEDGVQVVAGIVHFPEDEQVRYRDRKWYLQEVLDRIKRDWDGMTGRTVHVFAWPTPSDWRHYFYGAMPVKMIPPERGSGEELDVTAAQERLRKVYATYKQRLEDLRAY
jgi:hypothetical protein